MSTNPSFSEINDIRLSTEFNGVTFSNFKKSEVKKELLNSLLHSKIEPACYWTAEFICSGHYGELWDVIILFYSKHIHMGNPKLGPYLELRVQNFKEIINGGYVGQELRLRNNEKIRKLFAEIICILCDAERKHCFDEIKIKKTEFDITQISDKFKAPNITYAVESFGEDDPKELFIPANELAYSISKDGKNVIDACYWIEWFIEFENICKQKKEKCICERRSEFLVEGKYQMDVVWLIWDILLFETQQQENKILTKIVNSLKRLFCLKYSPTVYKKRRFILYFVVSLLSEPFIPAKEMLTDKQKEKVSGILKKIDAIYKQVKKNEQSPNMDYLFKDVKSTNLEKTIEKLEKMSNFEESFTPRL
jgi:hypothetical protein